MEWVEVNRMPPDAPLSPLDGRYRNQTVSLSRYFSEPALMQYRVRVEVRWLQALSAEPRIAEVPAFTEAVHKRLDALIESFGPSEYAEIKAHEGRINHDVKAVEYFLKDWLKQNRLGHVVEMVHFGCTSEDINNLAYALMIRDALAGEMLPLLLKLQQGLKDMALRYRALPMLARTHGQPASPTTLGKEMANIAARLDRPLDLLRIFPIAGKMNGATGNFNAHVAAYPQVDWLLLSAAFVDRLGLVPNRMTTQIEPHDWMAELFDLLARINTILLDTSRDFWLYIMLGIFRQRPVAGEVGSSTMPHKVNPIDFENAEGNLGLANALFSHMSHKLPVSRLQRDLTDSTVLRNTGVAFGHTLLAWKSLVKGLGKVEADETRVSGELEGSWEVLAEAIQTLMRKYRIGRPYEHLKELTRGKEINATVLQEFIDKLRIPHKEKKRLLGLTPQRYTGAASRLVARYLELPAQGEEPDMGTGTDAETQAPAVEQAPEKTSPIDRKMKPKREGKLDASHTGRAVPKKRGGPQKDGRRSAKGPGRTPGKKKKDSEERSQAKS